MWRGRTGPLLVAAQVALTLAVIVNVAYIVQERLGVINRPTGLDLENTFWARLQPDKPPDNFAAMVEADLQYLNTLPDVVAASTTNSLPQTFAMLGLPFATRPDDLNKPGAGSGGRIFMGTDRFIDALGVKLIAGRTFDPAAIAPPAADFSSALARWPAESIITKTLADKLFPNGDALGKTMYVGLVNGSTKIVGIIGLFESAPMSGAGVDFHQTSVIIPMIAPGPGITYYVRTKAGRRDAVMAMLEKDFAERMPGRFIERIQSMEQTTRNSRSGLRSSTIILTTVAGVVALVTMLGIAGLAAFNVAARRKQLGTRRALGATKYHIVRYFLVENWLITTLGGLVGCALAIAIGVQLSQMYRMPSLPLYYLAGGVAGVWVLGVMSVLLPARRAASISPAVATRTV